MTEPFATDYVSYLMYSRAVAEGLAHEFLTDTFKGLIEQFYKGRNKLPGWTVRLTSAPSACGFKVEIFESELTPCCEECKTRNEEPLNGN